MTTTPPNNWRAEFWEPLQTRIDRKYAESKKTSFDDEDFLRECNHLHSIQELLNPQLENLLASQSAAHEMKMKELVESKDSAYKERNMLVCALTKLFPAYLARHDKDDIGWERDWMWIVYIDLPAGQVSWHLHDSDVVMFKHLTVKENRWDGHNTERKYERLQALALLSEEQ